MPPCCDGSACGCSLDFLTDQLYLTSFVGFEQAAFLRHFFRHYTNCVGVRPNHMHIFVDEAQSNVSAGASTLSVLLSAGIPESSVELVRRVEAWTWDWARMRINRWIVSLPKDAWVISADADEHFYYPCDMPDRAKVSHIFCAEMTDRVGQDGRLAEVADSPGLGVQFPHKCYFRQNIRQSMNRQKVILMRVRDRYWYNVSQELELAAMHKQPRQLVFEGKVIVRQFETAHKTYLQIGGRGECHSLGEFAHYTMTHEQLRFLGGSHKLQHPDRFVRDDYAQLRALLQHATDLRQHRYCRAPAWYTSQRHSTHSHLTAT